MRTFAQWSRQGERLPVRLGGQAFHISSHRQGSGPLLTLLHGFPTSSHDWAETIAQLPDLDTLTFDFLGFGDSDKPQDHDYSIHEQADLVEAMWSHHGVRTTFLAVHDYAVSVAEELLARRHLSRSAPRAAGAGSVARSGARTADRSDDHRRDVHRLAAGHVSARSPSTSRPAA
jgi:pimeloyl-ACP methyl ester carboxylesterase